MQGGVEWCRAAWRGAGQRGAVQLRSITEVAPRQLFLCVNRSPIRYDLMTAQKSVTAEHGPNCENMKHYITFFES